MSRRRSRVLTRSEAASYANQFRGFEERSAALRAAQARGVLVGRPRVGLVRLDEHGLPSQHHPVRVEPSPEAMQAVQWRADGVTISEVSHRLHWSRQRVYRAIANVARWAAQGRGVA